MRVTLSSTALLFLVAASDLAYSNPLADDTGWVVSASAVVSATRKGEPTILDARTRTEWSEGHAPGSLVVDWTSFTPQDGSRRGELLRDNAILEKRIRKLGISNKRPVYVIGRANGGWGEAGRIVWMLRTLGHQHAAWVNGGMDALEAEGLSISTESSVTEIGDFRVDPRDNWSIDRQSLKRVYADDGVRLLDTRSLREFRGATPYGESRGGHIPGAEHLHFQSLLARDGTLKSPDAIHKLLRKRDVTPDARIITYCTGGVRSAWVTSVLLDLGYSNVQNFPGSTWHWSAGPPASFPLAD